MHNVWVVADVQECFRNMVPWIQISVGCNYISTWCLGTKLSWRTVGAQDTRADLIVPPLFLQKPIYVSLLTWFCRTNFFTSHKQSLQKVRTSMFMLSAFTEFTELSSLVHQKLVYVLHKRLTEHCSCITSTRQRLLTSNNHFKISLYLNFKWESILKLSHEILETW
jgi:hypothetical protein